MLQVNTYSSFSAVEDIQKGREGMVLMCEKHLRAREKGGRGTLSSPPFSLACSLAINSPSLPLWTPTGQAKDNQDIL